MSSSGSINNLGLQYIGAATPSISPNYQPGIVHGGFGSQGGDGGGDSGSATAAFSMNLMSEKTLLLFLLLTVLVI